MDNPYDPPAIESGELPHPPITDDIVRQLIDGADIETLALYDLSDCHIYGRKHRRKLTGALAVAAENAGCEPTVYQTVLWWCLVFMPVAPLGVYFVIPWIECDDSGGDAEQYRAVRASWDAWQVGFHYGVMLSLLIAIGTAVFLRWML